MNRVVLLALLVALPGCALIRFPVQIVGAVGTKAIDVVTQDAGDPATFRPR